MRATTETLSQVTNLLAIVSAPPIDTATIRHVEVLLLQPQVLMVVVITSTGGVSKKVLPFERPVDQGLAAWAAAYLNERLEGVSLGARTLHSKLNDPSLGASERGFLERLAPAFTELADTAEDTPLRGRRRPPAVRAPLPGPDRDQRADGHPRAPRGAAQRPARRPRPARRARAHRPRERAARPALAGLRRLGLRPALAPPRHRLGPRARAHGLRRRDPHRARGRPPALALHRGRLRRARLQPTSH